MKLRSGFVSNSSSSSFVCIGARIPQEKLEKMGWWSEDEVDIEKMPEGFDILCMDDGDNDIVGIVLADGEDYLEKIELTEKEISKTMAKAEKVLGKPVKLFIGTRPS